MRSETCAKPTARVSGPLLLEWTCTRVGHRGTPVDPGRQFCHTAADWWLHQARRLRHRWVETTSQAPDSSPLTRPLSESGAQHTRTTVQHLSMPCGSSIILGSWEAAGTYIHAAPPARLLLPQQSPTRSLADGLQQQPSHITLDASTSPAHRSVHTRDIITTYVHVTSGSNSSRQAALQITDSHLTGVTSLLMQSSAPQGTALLGCSLVVSSMPRMCNSTQPQGHTAAALTHRPGGIYRWS